MRWYPPGEVIYYCEVTDDGIPQLTRYQHVVIIIVE